MLVPRLEAALPNSYEIPKWVQYWPVVEGGILGLIWGVLVMAPRYSWLAPDQSEASWGQATIGFGVLTAVFAGSRLWHWAFAAHYYVLAVQWDDNQLALHTRRSGPFRTQWNHITRADIPQYPGYRGPSAAQWFTARLVVSGREGAYRIPLSWDAGCEGFLRVMETKVTLIQTDGEQAARPSE